MASNDYVPRAQPEKDEVVAKNGKTGKKAATLGPGSSNSMDSIENAINSPNSGLTLVATKTREIQQITAIPNSAIVPSQKRRHEQDQSDLSESEETAINGSESVQGTSTVAVGVLASAKGITFKGVDMSRGALASVGGDQIFGDSSKIGPKKSATRNVKVDVLKDADGVSFDGGSIQDGALAATADDQIFSSRKSEQRSEQESTSQSGGVNRGKPQRPK